MSFIIKDNIPDSEKELAKIFVKLNINLQEELLQYMRYQNETNNYVYKMVDENVQFAKESAKSKKRNSVSDLFRTFSL